MAHELAHVVQQSGATSSAPPLRDGSPAYEAFERDADSAAASVVGGLRDAPRLRAGPGVQRKPKTAKPGQAASGFWIMVAIEEQVSGHEFCVRGLMQGYERRRRQIEGELAAGTAECFGKRPKQEVVEPGVYPFWIGTAPGAGQEAAPGDEVELSAADQQDVNDEANQRFWKRIGDIRVLSKDDPAEASYRELWKQERSGVLHERSDPYSPELRLFAALGGMPAAGTEAELSPDQFAWMRRVEDMLGSLTERDWIRLRRTGLPQLDWQGLAKWLPRFIARQRAEDRTIERVSKLDVFGDLPSAYEVVEGAGAGRGSRDPVAGEAFGQKEKMEQGADDFRAVFRARAVEVGIDMLGRARVVMLGQRALLRSKEERAKLFAALRRPTVLKEVLDKHPMLRDPDALKGARNQPTAEALGDWLDARAEFQAVRTTFCIEHLREKPDVVFGWDVVVGATLNDLGLEDTIQAMIIQRGWGRPDGSSLWPVLHALGMIAFMVLFPTLGVAVGLYSAFTDFDEQVVAYAAEKDAQRLGMRTTDPSALGVWLAAGNLLLSALPGPAHDLEQHREVDPAARAARARGGRCRGAGGRGGERRRARERGGGACRQGRHGAGRADRGRAGARARQRRPPHRGLRARDRDLQPRAVPEPARRVPGRAGRQHGALRPARRHPRAARR